METQEAQQFVQSVLAPFIGIDMDNYQNKLAFADRFNYCIYQLYQQRDYAVRCNVNPYLYCVGVDVITGQHENGKYWSQLEYIYTNHLQASMRQRYNA